jgi:hypothetical protein
MRSLLRHKPSPAMVVALLALILAASGTAIAAGQLVTGDNLIKPRTLSANRLRNHSITGLQVSLSKLGQVPNAKNAAHAFVAGSSENAVNAQDAASAASAKNAAALGGQPPGAFEAASNFVRTGLVSAAAGQTVGFASFGPFTLALKCTSSAQAEIDAASTESGSVAFGVAMPVAGATYRIDSTTSGFHDESGSFIAPSGKSYAGVITVGVGFPSAPGSCVGNGLISQS